MCHLLVQVGGFFVSYDFSSPWSDFLSLVALWSPIRMPGQTLSPALAASEGVWAEIWRNPRGTSPLQGRRAQGWSTQSKRVKVACICQLSWHQSSFSLVPITEWSADFTDCLSGGRKSLLGQQNRFAGSFLFIWRAEWWWRRKGWAVSGGLA